MEQILERVRIGVLGAARIAPVALTRPARLIPRVKVTAVAARDPRRADLFARRQGIPDVRRDYAELIDDPDVDAVYIPLPNGLHAHWAVRAMEAGKHVLIEKPVAANAAEARLIADTAARTGLVAMEAFHYRYHPLARRVREILDDGELGTVRRITASMCFPLPVPGDIRYRFDLAGGALMDAGCYAVHALRMMAGDAKAGIAAESVEIAGALAKTAPGRPDVDRSMTAALRLPGGATGLVRASLLGSRVMDIGLRVEGDRGVLKVGNFVMPHLPHRFSVTVDGVKRREHLGQAGKQSTYKLQLEAFADAVLHGAQPLTPASDGVQTMELIDRIYGAAGLPVRGS